MNSQGKIQGRFLKDSAFTLVTRFVLILTAMGASVITARVLGPERKGELAVILLAPTLLMNLGGLSITSANVFLIGNRKARLNEIFWNSIFFSLVLGLLLVGIYLAAESWFRPFFRNADPTLLYLAVLTVPFSLFYLNGIFIPLGERKVRVFNVLKTIEPAAYLLGLGLLVWGLGLGVPGGLGAYFIGVVFGIAGLLVYAAGKIPLGFRLNFALIREGGLYGVKCHLESAVWFLIRRSAVLLVNRFMTSADVGFYVIAISMSEALWHLPQAVSTVLFPEICAKNDECNRKEISSRVCRNTLFILFFSAAALGLLTYLLVIVLYGPQFLPSVKAVWILLPGSVLLCTYPILGAYMRGINRPLVPGYIACVMFACTVVFNIFFIPRFGIYGAALATSGTYAAGFVVMTCIYGKMTGEKFVSFLIIRREDIRYYRRFFAETIRPRLAKLILSRNDKTDT